MMNSQSEPLPSGSEEGCKVTGIVQRVDSDRSHPTLYLSRDYPPYR